ncbi:hypothetical protein ABZP36_022019 [Zizania latifolia]
MDIKERIRRSPPPHKGEALLPASSSLPGPRGGRKGRARAVVLPLSAAALVVCAVVLLLFAGGSAARRGQFLDADPTGFSRGGGRGDLHLARPRDGKRTDMRAVSIF